MADTMVAENRTELVPSEPQVNLWALVQRSFEERQYTLLRQEGDYALYACLHGDVSAQYYVCDILIVSPLATLAEAEAATARLDGIAEKVRRALLCGKPVHKELRVQKHGFLKLHRPYICHSYTFREKPVGFQLRPLILISEGTNIWEYFPGLTTRVDAVSFPTALDGYLKDHWGALKTAQMHLMNVSKFRYPKLARRLISYGPIPIIAFLLFNLFWAIAQYSLPIALEGAIGLSLALYGGCIGAAYLLHGLFERAQRAELQEPTPCQSTRVYPADSVPQVMPLTPEPQAVEIAKVEVEKLSPIVTPPQIKVGFNRSQVETLIRKILTTTELEGLSASLSSLFDQIFQRVLETAHLESPPHPTLVDLLKLTRSDSTIAYYNRDLTFWISKLETQTPFDPNEVKVVKIFLLRLLFQLQLLPEDLQKLVKASPWKLTAPGAPKGTPSVPKGAPEGTLRGPPPDQLPTLAPVRVALPKSPPAPEPAPAPPPAELPDIEVDSQVFTEIPQVNSYQVRKISERRENGIYCTLYIDKRKPHFVDLIEQFAASTQDFDITRNYVDINHPEDALTERELAGVSYPVVVVGCGEHRQILTYGQQQEDAQRLHSAIKSFFHETTTQPRAQETAEEEEGPLPSKPLRKEPQQGEELISLKERVRKTDDSGQVAPKLGAHEPSKIANEEPKVSSKEELEAPPKERLKEVSIPKKEEEVPNSPPKTESTETETPNVGLTIAKPPRPTPLRPLLAITLKAEPPKPPLKAKSTEAKAIPKTEVIERPQETPKIPITPPESPPKKEGKELPKVENPPSPRSPLTVAPKTASKSEPSPIALTAPPPSPYKRISPLMIKNLNQHLLLIDGTNLAFLFSDARKDDSGPRLTCIFQVIEMLTRLGFAKENMVVFFDASIEMKFKHADQEEDYARLIAYMQEGTHPKCRIVASGSQADTALLSLSSNTDGAFIILTNDGMDDQPEWAFRHRVPVILDQNDLPHPLVESPTALMNRFHGKGPDRPDRHKREGHR